HDDFGLQ
nr:Chain B, MNV1-NS3 C term peptide [Murine norovirus 1]8A8X_D Chain D, MNV1-NS3 C term peptide [Murine norovirus 1]